MKVFIMNTMEHYNMIRPRDKQSVCLHFKQQHGGVHQFNCF